MCVCVHKVCFIRCKRFHKNLFGKKQKPAKQVA